jgi:hypothetical protein
VLRHLIQAWNSASPDRLATGGIQLRAAPLVQAASKHRSVHYKCIVKQGEMMKAFLLPAAAVCTMLGGCVAVPVSDPGVHVSGSARVYNHPGYGPPRHAHPHYPRGQVYDRDGDGVPNRHDRRPNNPYRY